MTPAWKGKKPTLHTCRDCKKAYSEWRLWLIDGEWYCPSCTQNAEYEAKVMPPDAFTARDKMPSDGGSDWSG